MALTRFRVETPRGNPLSGLRIVVSFELRIAGLEENLPGEVTGTTDAEGRCTLRLPDPEGLASAPRLRVLGEADAVLYEAQRSTSDLACEEIRLELDDPTQPILRLELRTPGGGAPAGNLVVLLLARAPATTGHAVLLAGRTDATGVLTGALPVGRYEEASLLVRGPPDLVLPIDLEAGRFPAVIALSMPAVEASPPAALVKAEPRPPALSPAGFAPPRMARARSRSRDWRPLTPAVLGLLAATLLAGAVLRFYNLDGPSLWYDELATWKYASYPTIGKVLKQVDEVDVHPPGYYLLIHLVERFSDSAFALRLPSVLAGIAGIGALFALGRRLWGNADGLIAAGLYAVLWMPIRYAQEARPYAMLMLFSTLAVLAWSAMLRSLARRGAMGLSVGAAWVLCATALTWLHYFGLVFVGLLSLGALGWAVARLPRPEVLARVAAAVALPGLLYLPWLQPTWSDLQRPTWRVNMDEEHVPSFMLSYVKLLFNQDLWMVGLAGLVLAGGALGAVLRLRAGEALGSPCARAGGSRCCGCWSCRRSPGSRACTAPP